MKNHLESNPITLAPPDGHFSQCTVVKQHAAMLYVSGQVARDKSGKTVGVGNMRLQAEQVLKT